MPFSALPTWAGKEVTRSVAAVAPLIIAVATFFVAGCNTQPEAGGSGTSGGGSSGSCVSPDFAGAANAKLIEFSYDAVTPGEVEIHTLCQGDTHYFLVDPPCDGWLQLVLKEDPAASPQIFDNTNQDMDLVLTEHYHPSTPGQVARVQRRARE